MPALAEQVAGRFGARIAGSPEAVLASGVDGMVIAAPTGFHTELIELCVAAGLPAFCEKPVSRDSDEAAQLARRVAAAGVQVQIGYPRRFDPAFAAARAAVADGELGMVHTVRSSPSHLSGRGIPHRHKPSRSVSCTNPCTNLVPDLRVSRTSHRRERAYPPMVSMLRPGSRHSTRMLDISSMLSPDDLQC